MVVKPELSQIYDQLLPTSKSLEIACKHHCTGGRRPVTCVYLDLGIFQTVKDAKFRMCVRARASARACVLCECVCACAIVKKCVHAAEDAGSAEEGKKESEGKNETKRNCRLET